MNSHDIKELLLLLLKDDDDCYNNYKLNIGNSRIWLEITEEFNETKKFSLNTHTIA